jgi:WD40 repeat protein
MSRIFLSHSSVNELEAVALKQWLADNGWGDEDVFLDIDPERGLVAGERWQEALRKAADRCEAVVFIVSPAWAKSKWCLAEFLLAKNLHKLIFGVVLEEVPIGELPTEMTSEWQLCHLVGNEPTETVRFQHREASHEISFSIDGLRRLKNGLRKAGLNADFFPWPPKDDPNRSPYRGLEPLDVHDAAVFFGRDVEILRGLDVLRGMRDSKDKKLFIILGASGTGKSSFLRAGLLPRLVRDDHHFFPLPVIRPERKPFSGEKGLVSALHRAYVELKLSPKNRSNIENALTQSPTELIRLLEALQDAASSRLLTSTEDGATPTPTLVLPVDQAEELFNVDAGQEAQDFLRLIGTVLRSDSNSPALRMIVAFTIRSDRYEPLQTAPELTGLQSMVFDDLKPMPFSRFREVILGPAKRVSVQGGKFDIRPELVNCLEEDCSQGGDTLPLLSLILFRLYCDYGSDGNLSLDEYDTMGGLRNIVKKEAESILSTDEALRNQQLEWLHAAFIPWLATINPVNNQPIRRLAKLDDLPLESHPLILALVEKRLLLTDQRNGNTIVEVTHEALLRQWDVLAGWLQTERGDLKDADSLERAAQAWKDNSHRAAWLIEGERLTNAEALAAKPGFRQLLTDCNEFLNASRLRENARQEEEMQRKQAELNAAHRLAEEQRERANAEEARANAETQAKIAAENNATNLNRRRKQLWAALIAALLLTLCAGYLWISAQSAERQARSETRHANALKLAAQAQAMLTDNLVGSDERAYLQILAANRLGGNNERDNEVDSALLQALVTGADMRWIAGTSSSIKTLAFSPDGTRIVSGSDDKTLRLWDANTGQPIGQPLKGHESPVNSVAFSPDGTRIVSGSGLSHFSTILFKSTTDNTLRLWDAKTGQPIGQPLKGHLEGITIVAFSPDGTRIVSGSWDKTLRLWDAKTGQPVGQPLNGHQESINSVAFSPDGTRIVSGSGDLIGSDHTIRLWDARTGQPIGQPLKGHESPVNSVAFSPDGTRIVSGSDDKTLRLWDARTGQPIGQPLKGHESPVNSVAFSPDDTRIVSGGEDQTLRLWDARTGQPIGQPPKGHESPVNSVAFSPDGSRIISGSWDKTLRLWDAKTGQPVGQPLNGHQESINSVAFSPDGSRIISGSSDKILRLWPAPKIWPDELCKKLTRNMSHQEWRTWVSPDFDYIKQCPGLPIPPDEPELTSVTKE